MILAVCCERAGQQLAKLPSWAQSVDADVSSCVSVVDPRYRRETGGIPATCAWLSER